MFLPRRLLSLLSASLLLLALAGCGGGADSTTTTPTPPTQPNTPTDPAPPAPTVQLTALSGSATHATLSWSGGTAGSLWKLERRAGDSGDYTAIADVDSGAGLWMDSGLSADTAYAYRLRRADASVAATASVRTATEVALTTPAPEPAGNSLALPFTTTTTRLSAGDGNLQLELPAGSFAAAGTATLQATSNPLADGVGPGLRLVLPERPARTLTLSLRYSPEEDVDDITQDRIALRQGDGSWWVLPLAGHDEGQRLLQVQLPPALWQEQPTASALLSRSLASVRGVSGEFVRVKAHKMLPAAATVRVLGRQRFVPVSIYVMQSSEGCAGPVSGDVFCVPTPVLRDATVPILNTKAGYQRQWTLEGSATPAASLGTLSPEPQAGVVYTAPAQVPATNPLTLRFTTTHAASGRRLVLSAKLRVAEDAWVGTLDAFIGDLVQGDMFKLDTRWNLDAALSTETRRVYKPAGYAEHLHSIVDPVCTHTVAPTRLSLAQAQTTGQLVVDESTSPARYTLDLATLWDSRLTVACPNGSVSTATKGGHVWSAQGVVVNGRIQGLDNGLGERQWSLARPQ